MQYLFMAHGTPDPSNAYYAVMQDRLNKLYDGKVFDFIQLKVIQD